MPKQKTFKCTVEFEVDETWIADGFEITEERAQEMIMNDLSYATSSEVKAKILKAPSQVSIRKAQGYETEDKGTSQVPTGGL